MEHRIDDLTGAVRVKVTGGEWKTIGHVTRGRVYGYRGRATHQGWTTEVSCDCREEVARELAAWYANRADLCEGRR